MNLEQDGLLEPLGVPLPAERSIIAGPRKSGSGLPHKVVARSGRPEVTDVWSDRGIGREAFHTLGCTADEKPHD